ncbi:MAG TPA: serine hydrolase domain-containing protein [Kofleriaceae bacterium]|nr:serine hydrolase domain-containing protein [Kofleriaceae bacterium]
MHRFRSTLRVLGAAVLGVVVALGVLACGRPTAHEPAPQTLEDLLQRIQRMLEEAHLPGVGLAIVQGGEVVYAGGIGKSDLARGTPITADTRFRVGSITKTLIALAILKLRDDGKLSLESKLTDLAPEVALDNPWEATHPVRVGHLLEHTAGFDDMHPVELIDPGGINLPLRDVLAVHPVSRRPRWPPGTRMSYANPGYTVAGYLIEKVTGRAFEDYVHDALLAPLGMTTASLRATPEAMAALARAYDDDGQEVPFVPILHRPAGNLMASPAELAQLVRLFLNRGKVGDQHLVSEASVARAERCETLPYPGYQALADRYGLGNRAEPVLGFIAYGHDGAVDGYASTYAYLPAQQVGWVVLFNSLAARQMRERIVALVAAFSLRGLDAPLPTTFDVPAETLAGYTGYYQLASPRQELLRFKSELLDGRLITLEDGVLRQRGLLARRSALLPVSTVGFRHDKDAAPDVLFARADDGTPVMIADGQYYEKTSPWPHRIHLAVLAVACAISLSSIGYGLVWGVRFAVSRRFRAAGLLAVRGLPMLATVSSCVWLWLMQQPHTMLAYGTQTPSNVAAFVLSLVYPALTVAALAVTLRAFTTRTEAGAIAIGHGLLVSLANLVLCLYLWSWGLVGLRLWLA